MTGSWSSLCRWVCLEMMVGFDLILTAFDLALTCSHRPEIIHHTEFWITCACHQSDPPPHFYPPRNSKQPINKNIVPPQPSIIIILPTCRCNWHGSILTTKSLGKTKHHTPPLFLSAFHPPIRPFCRIFSSTHNTEVSYSILSHSSFKTVIFSTKT